MNIVLIGTGMVAGTHVAAIKASKLPINLYGILGRNPERAQEFATLHETRMFASIEDIAKDNAVDFVILATPPDARMEICKTLVAHQKPVLMEKPIERDLISARAIVEMFEDARLPLGIMFQHRARAASVALKEIINSDGLGNIVSIEMRVPWWRDQSYYDEPGRGTYGRDGGGVMISQAIHTLDLAMWLCGPITSVQAMMRTTRLHELEAEDWAGALFETENGAVGTLMATTAAWPGSAETITVQGTKGSAHLGSGILTLDYFDGRRETIGATASTGGGADPMAFTHEWHQTMIEDFAEVLRTGNSPLSSGRDALKTHAVIDAMQRAVSSKSQERVEP